MYFQSSGKRNLLKYFFSLEGALKANYQKIFKRKKKLDFFGFFFAKIYLMEKKLIKNFCTFNFCKLLSNTSKKGLLSLNSENLKIFTYS